LRRRWRGGTLLPRSSTGTEKHERKASRANQSEEDFATIHHLV